MVMSFEDWLGVMVIVMLSGFLIWTISFAVGFLLGRLYRYWKNHERNR